MKFLADMGISPRVVDELRQKGHDAVHLAEQGLHRMADGDILQKARQENRVLLTQVSLSRKCAHEFYLCKISERGNINKTSFAESLPPGWCHDAGT